MSEADLPGAVRKPWFDRLAHDLRGPLTSLQTAAYLLRSDPSGSNAKELADIVVRQSQRMTKMIEELDDWSRAEQRRLVDRSERIDVQSALDMAIASVHGCTLDPVLGEGVAGVEVQGDAARLTQLFRTLVDQVLARDAAGARIVVARVNGDVEVAFSDRGPNVDASTRAHWLVAPQIPPLDGGLGMRLLLAKAIAEGHGGALRIDATETESLRFTCTLPIAE